MDFVISPIKKVHAENWLLLALICVKLLINLVFAQPYGYFRDEFFYLQLSERLTDGPIDMPLLAPALLWLARMLLGESLTVLHLFPVLAGCLVIGVSVQIVRELGGNRFAQLLAGLCTLLAPVNLGINSTFSYDSFDQLFWVLSLYFVFKVLKNENSKNWLGFGVAAGLGLLTKQTMLILGFALTLALLSTSARKYFRDRWIWLAAGIALLGLLPYLIMQIQLDWPILNYVQFYSSAKTYPVSPLEFLFFQIISQNPLTLPVWLSGLIYLLFARTKPFRPIGLTTLFLFGIFVFLQVKFYFLAPVYPLLFAFGSVWFSEFLAKKNWRWLAKAYIPVIILSGTLLAPFALPLLPVDDFIFYSKGPGGNLGLKQERNEENELPQFFADRFGWPELAAEVVRIYQNLSPEEQKQVYVFTGNYGEAGAIQFFGKSAGLTRILSGHGQYFYWGPGECTGKIMITVGISREPLERIFKNVTLAGVFTCRYCMPYENRLPIFLCRDLLLPMQQLWPTLQHID
jgi:hypothetical protein